MATASCAEKTGYILSVELSEKEAARLAALLCVAVDHDLEPWAEAIFDALPEMEEAPVFDSDDEFFKFAEGMNDE